MKLSHAIFLLFFAIMTVGAHAQVNEDSGLPSGGENTPPPSIQDSPPIENTQEFNQDVDDFEKKISKEVPPATAKPSSGAAKASDPAAEKARAVIKRAHETSAAATAKKAKKNSAKKKKKIVKKPAPKKQPPKKASDE